MLNKIIKTLIIISLFFFVGLNYSSAALLNSDTKDAIKQGSRTVGTAAGYDESTDGDTILGMVASVIEVVLSLLGVIFVLLIIYAGFKWMTAAGDSEQVSKAGGIMKMAIIGLIIIISAYAITYFVFSRLPTSSVGIS